MEIYGQVKQLTLIQLLGIQPLKLIYPQLKNSLQKKYAKEGLTILAVSTDSQKSLSKVRSYIRAKKYSFDVILDPNQQIFKKMNASIMPTDILIGKDGDVLWRHYGYLPGDEKYIEAEIRNALGIIE